jgi:very-short-patch-repair endonuclease
LKTFYRPSLTQAARKLRNSSTKAEILLWQHLKGKRMLGLDFHRQKPIGNYIVDFLCTKARLAIEIDGYTHRFDEVVRKDDSKNAYLEAMGIQVIRFRDEEVINDISDVLRRIEATVHDRLPGHTPVSPLPRGDGTHPCIPS